MLKLCHDQLASISNVCFQPLEAPKDATGLELFFSSSCALLLLFNLDWKRHGLRLGSK